LWGVQAYSIARITNLSPRLSGLPCDSIFGFLPLPYEPEMELMAVFCFSLSPSFFSVLFSCPDTSFVVPNALPVYLSSEYSLPFVT
jgi:hypothetical protein